ncbi:PPE family protein [Mycobacterium heidelbergense]|uniref:PPE family protein n=1 Tax=Mycobacterium heidelbergense TaxID=53376 RepID=UPI001151F51D|nr:PPE family protein [Mycobacterium heidelbergense]MCV7049466.1 PPE family protein [Mycobacterium heidelbergense]
MDLGAIPPEITSALVYSGPGSTPLVAAASSWNALAAELNSAAIGYDNVVTQLSTEEWLGPASSSMAAAVQPYVEWITNAAALAEQTATQSSSAAAAYETVLASVVPPTAIAANRAQLAQALANNVLGQNTGLIAQLESQYGEYWAQDAASMYSYAASSSTAANVTPFTAAPQVANPAAAATQTAAAATSASSVQQTLNNLISQFSSQLQSLISPITGPIQSEFAYLESSSGPLSWLWGILFGSPTAPNNVFTLLTDYSPYASFFYYTEGLPNFSIGIANFLTQTAKTVGAIGPAAGAAAAAAVPKGLPGLGGLLGGGAAHAAAALGTASPVGHLSVPPAWAGTLAGAHSSASAIPVSNVREAPDAGAGNLLGGMPLAGAGRGAAGSGPRYGFRPTVMTRPPSAG